MKKIESQMAEVMKEIISDGNAVVAIEGKEYYLSRYSSEMGRQLLTYQ